MPQRKRMGRVHSLWLYPVKGMGGICVNEKPLYIDQNMGVAGDRQFAIGRKADMDVSDWRPKGQFHVGMNTPGVSRAVGVDDEYLGADQALTREFVEQQLLPRLNLDPNQYTLVDSEGQFRLTDSNEPYVSFLNLATVKELSKWCGQEIDPQRFRMNVWVEDMPSGAELNYIQGHKLPHYYPMQVGNLRLGIDKLAQRCKAIDQSPATGQYDLELHQRILPEFLKSKSYAGSPKKGSHSIMGWYALPASAGTLYQDNPVWFGE